MIHIARAALVASLLTLPALAQDFLLYKFEGGCSSEVVNYAPQGSTIGNGTRQTTNALTTVSGVFGDGLAGSTTPTSGFYNRVATGWYPATDPVIGDFTFAMYVKQRVAPPSTSYFFGGASGLRMFTGGVAGTGLALRNAMATGADVMLTTNLQALAANTWVHVALVVNANAGLATWYLDGVAVQQVTGLNGGANSALFTSGEFLIGGYPSTYTNAYDLDEVLLSRRIYTPAEVAQLANGTRAGHGRYDHGTTTQCNTGLVTLAVSGGRPYLGNASFALEVATPTTMVHVLTLGFSRCSFGGLLPLPLDGGTLLPLLAGCTLLADAPLVLAAIGGPSPTTFPLPIAATAPMGAALFGQALALDPATNTIAMSSGLALGVGN